MIAWGADIGYRRLSLAAVQLDPPMFHVVTHVLPGPQELDEAGTMRALQSHALMAALELRDEFDGALPGLILVERPMVQKFHANEKMHYSYALVTAELSRFAMSCDGQPPVRGIQVNTWRKNALGEGFGRADKNTVLAWARRFGYGGSSHDEADAIGVAVAGLQQLRAEAAPEHEQMTLG